MLNLCDQVHYPNIARPHNGGGDGIRSLESLIKFKQQNVSAYFKAHTH
jgi:hypothetical protein